MRYICACLCKTPKELKHMRKQKIPIIVTDNTAIIYTSMRDKQLYCKNGSNFCEQYDKYKYHYSYGDARFLRPNLELYDSGEEEVEEKNNEIYYDSDEYDKTH